jgi:hypothetical protein
MYTKHAPANPVQNEHDLMAESGWFIVMRAIGIQSLTVRHKGLILIRMELNAKDSDICTTDKCFTMAL